ncbi:MAG: nucleoside hydrolase, partial [Corynebacterium sp.]|nr:nucleoside hydrolase [Corynebacterium sp.]
VAEGPGAALGLLAAAMVLLDAVPATCAPATVQVEAESELLRGTTVADWVGGGEHSDPVGPYWGLPANARVLTELDPEDVLREFSPS